MNNAYLGEIRLWRMLIRQVHDSMNPLAKWGVVLHVFCGFQGGGNYVTMKTGMVYRLLEAALVAGKLKKVRSYIEGTSGATGIGLSSIARDEYFGTPNAKVIVVMNRNVPAGKRYPIYYNGAQIMRPLEGLTNIATARKLGGGGWNNGAWEVSEDGCFNLDQYDNPENGISYRDIVGPQILLKMKRHGLGLLSWPVGTGGTGIGLGGCFRKESPNTRLVGAMCASGQVIPGMRSREQMSEIHSPWEAAADQIIEVNQLHSYLAALQIQKYTGMMMGISAGASYVAMLKELKNYQLGGNLDALRSRKDGKVHAMFIAHDGLRVYTANKMPIARKLVDGKMVWEYLW